LPICWPLVTSSWTPVTETGGLLYQLSRLHWVKLVRDILTSVTWVVNVSLWWLTMYHKGEKSGLIPPHPWKICQGIPPILRTTPYPYKGLSSCWSSVHQPSHILCFFARPIKSMIFILSRFFLLLPQD
jgi:hypothetical protein